MEFFGYEVGVEYDNMRFFYGFFERFIWKRTLVI
jgi:hypothetical protein